MPRSASSAFGMPGVRHERRRFYRPIRRALIAARTNGSRRCPPHPARRASPGFGRSSAGFPGSPRWLRPARLAVRLLRQNPGNCTENLPSSPPCRSPGCGSAPRGLGGLSRTWQPREGARERLGQVMGCMLEPDHDRPHRGYRTSRLVSLLSSIAAMTALSRKRSQVRRVKPSVYSAVRFVVTHPPVQPWFDSHRSPRPPQSIRAAAPGPLPQLMRRPKCA